LIQWDFLKCRDAQNLQKSVERQIEAQTFLDNGHEHINRYGYPYLCFHGILGSPQKRFNPQVLFNPAKEQLDSPTKLIEHGDGQRRKNKVIGQKDQVSVVLPVIEPDTPQLFGKSGAGIETRKDNGLIAEQVGRLIDGAGVQPTASQIRLGSDDKKGLVLMNVIEAGKIEIGAVEDVKTSGLGYQVIQDPDIMHFPVCYLDKRRDGAPEIEKGMKLDRPFVFAEDGPGKKGKAEVDGRGIESIDGLVEFQPEVLIGVENASLMDEHLGKVCVYPPIPGFVGMGQCIAGNIAADSHVVQSIPHRTQAGLDVPEAFSISQLSEGHTKEMIETGKAFDLVVASISADTFSKLIERQEIHDLGKDG